MSSLLASTSAMNCLCGYYWNNEQNKRSKVVEGQCQTFEVACKFGVIIFQVFLQIDLDAFINHIWVVVPSEGLFRFMTEKGLIKMRDHHSLTNGI